MGGLCSNHWICIHKLYVAQTGLGLERKEKELILKTEANENKSKELEELKNKEMEELERISRLSQEEAKKMSTNHRGSK